MSMSEINEMLDVYFSRLDSNKFDNTPFTLSEYRRQLTFEFIKEAYYKQSPKRSLRCMRGSKDADDLRMRDKRSLAYAQHYRDLWNESIMECTGSPYPGLEPDKMESMEDKLSGHKITEMQYFELNTMADYPVFKAIVSKRICDVKKISNTEFRKLMTEYDQLVQMLIGQLESKESVLFAAIELFTLEWKYNIELFYKCAVEAEKNGCEKGDVPRRKLATLCAAVSFPIHTVQKIVHTESRFIRNRQVFVPAIYNGSDWNAYEEAIINYLTLNYYFNVEYSIDDKPILEFFLKYSTPDDWAEYIMKEYDLRSVFQEKEWTNSRIRYVRKLFEIMIKEMETPKL